MIFRYIHILTYYIKYIILITYVKIERKKYKNAVRHSLRIKIANLSVYVIFEVIAEINMNILVNISAGVVG